MEIKTYSDISASLKGGNNSMGWNNTMMRNNALPIDSNSIFNSKEDALAYVNTSKIAYEGHIIAITEGGQQVAYIVDTTASDGLRRVGSDPSVICADVSSIVQSYVDNLNVSDISAASGQIVDKIWESKGKISATYRSLTTAEVAGLDDKIAEIKPSLSVTVEKLDTAEEGYEATYVVKQGGSKVGVNINIPKDKVISSAYVVDVKGNYDTSKEPQEISSFTVSYDGTVEKTVVKETEPDLFAQINNAYSGTYGGGDGKYIRITVTNAEALPIYIPVPELIDTYTGVTSDTISVDVNGNTREIAAILRPDSVETAHIKARQITTDRIALSAVTDAEIADNAVVERTIKDGNVTTSKIADGNVTTDKIAANAVTKAKLALSAVGTDNIEDDAVTGAKIADGTITDVNLATNSVTENKINAGAVTDVKIADGAVTENKIGAKAVSNEKIADYAINSIKLSADSVTEAKIQDGAVTTNKIADGNVTTDKLADSSVGSEKIKANAVSVAKLSSDVTDYITKQYTDATAYADGKIAALSGTSTNDSAAKTVDTITQTDGKLTVTYKDIEIAQEKVTNLTTDLGNISSNLTGSADGSVNARVSTAKSEAISTVVGTSGDDKTASTVYGAKAYADSVAGTKASEASAYVYEEAKKYTNDEIAKLSVDEITVGADSTVEYIKEENGKVSANAVKIQIEKSQVTNLTGDLEWLSTHVNAAEGDITGLKAISAAQDLRITQAESDIVEISGKISKAMHFKGVNFDVELSTGSTVIPVPPYETATDVPEDGDVVIVKNNKEFVWAQGQWNELGAEDIHATKAELQAEEDARKAADTVISTAVDNKVKVGNYGSALTNTAELSVVKINADDYHQAVAAGTLNPDAMYLVSSDYLNAYDQRVQNVGTAISATDAVNLSGMNEAISNAKTEIGTWALSGVKINDTVEATVSNGIASLSIELIDCGGAD